MPPSEAPSGCDLFEFLGERLIAKAEQQPITVVFRFADGERVYEVGPKDPLYKRLAKRRSEALRASLAKLRDKGEQR
jgi:hypothetical protein